MFSLLPLLALAAVAFVNGENTTIEEVPYQISLHAYGRPICGGSIISKDWVVTAGHCAKYPTSMYVVKAGSSYEIFDGTNHPVDSIVTHKDYGTNSHGIPVNDIALVHVEKPFAFDKTRQPIALFAEYEETPVGAMAVITGWGDIQEAGGSIHFLQMVSVPIVAKTDCNRAYSNLGGLPENQICAAYPDVDRHACQGNSGGPVAIGGRLSGVVSWGNGCVVPRNPGVYTEIAAYRAWIKLRSGV